MNKIQKGIYQHSPNSFRAFFSHKGIYAQKYFSTAEAAIAWRNDKQLSVGIIDGTRVVKKKRADASNQELPIGLQELVRKRPNKAGEYIWLEWRIVGQVFVGKVKLGTFSYSWGHIRTRDEAISLAVERRAQLISMSKSSA